MEGLTLQVLLNVLADEILRAHQRCRGEHGGNAASKLDLVLEAGTATMRALQGAYSVLCLVKGVGLVAFRDPYGIRYAFLKELFHFRCCPQPIFLTCAFRSLAKKLVQT